MKKIIRLNESSNIDWVSLIKDGIDNGYIPNEHDDNDIPYFTILNYAKDCGYINGSLFQVLNTERYSIKDAYNYCKKNIVETKEYKKTKKIVRITESDIHKIVNESVKRVLNEGKITNNKRMIYSYCNSPYYDEKIGHNELITDISGKDRDNSSGTIRIPTGRPATQDEIAKHNLRIRTRNSINFLANKFGIQREVLKTLTEDELLTFTEIASKIIDRGGLDNY